MTDIIFVIPGDLETHTGGYAYDREVLRRLPGFGVTVSHVALAGGFPNPTNADLTAAERRLRITAPDTIMLVDGLAFGAMPRALIAGLNRRIIALVHHPLYLEAGLSEGRAKALMQLEREALSLARHVVVTSAATQRLLSESLGVEAGRITVAEPGTDPAPRATGTGTPLQLLAVGAITLRKGYDILVRALAPLRDLDWRLSIVGALDRDPRAVSALRNAIEAAGLGQRITLTGAIDLKALHEAYGSADVFVSPSLFEGYGMVLGEAMARGLAIVSTNAGAATETVPDGAALKVPPGDVDALGKALTRLISDRKLRRRLADQAWDAGRLLPTWHETTRRICLAVLKAST